MDPPRSRTLERHLAERDALRYQKFQLSAKDRQQLLDEIETPLTETEAARFVEAIEGTIAFYRAWDAFETRHSPHSQIQRKVERLLAQFTTLEVTLKDLDWGTRRALAPFLVGQSEPSLPVLSARKPSELSLLDEHLGAGHGELEAVADACRAYLADEQGAKSGPRPRGARLAFAVEIADVLEAHGLSALIVSSGEGRYQGVLSICLEAAGTTKGDLRRLVPKAIKAFRESYRPAGVKSPRK